MAAIRGRDTKPELLIRSALHRAGFRFRVNAPLPGKPDLAFRRYRAAVFVHRCFWHMHDCPRFRFPAGDNAAFWKAKLERNAERDREVSRQLALEGWRQFNVWECALVGRGRLALPQVVNAVSEWLTSDAEAGAVAGIFE